MTTYDVLWLYMTGKTKTASPTHTQQIMSWEYLQALPNAPVHWPCWNSWCENKDIFLSQKQHTNHNPSAKQTKNKSQTCSQPLFVGPFCRTHVPARESPHEGPCSVPKLHQEHNTGTQQPNDRSPRAATCRTPRAFSLPTVALLQHLALHYFTCLSFWKLHVSNCARDAYKLSITALALRCK